MKPSAAPFAAAEILLATAVAILMSSCDNQDNKPEGFQKQAEQIAYDHSQITDAMREVLDLTAKAMVNAGIKGGRSVASIDSVSLFLGCTMNVQKSLTVDSTTTGKLTSRGNITIDFGNGSTCSESLNNRRGKIIDEIGLTVMNPGAAQTSTLTEQITFDSYYKDGIKLSGNYTVNSNQSHGPTSLETLDGVLVYADYSSTTWSGKLNFDEHTESPLSEQRRLTQITGYIKGSSTGTNQFTATITTPIIYNYTCLTRLAVPVNGVIDLTLGNTISEINYGNGNCDDAYTITTNGVTTKMTFNQKAPATFLH